LYQRRVNLNVAEKRNERASNVRPASVSLSPNRHNLILPLHDIGNGVKRTEDNARLPVAIAPNPYALIALELNDGDGLNIALEVDP
jgi:hypothetical protein